MANGETTMTVTKRALILRIPWDAVAQHLRPKFRAAHLTAEEVLKFVEKGRQEHRLGKTRLIRSLRELQS